MDNTQNKNTSEEHIKSINPEMYLQSDQLWSNAVRLLTYDYLNSHSWPLFLLSFLHLKLDYSFKKLSDVLCFGGGLCREES